MFYKSSLMKLLNIHKSQLMSKICDKKIKHFRVLKRKGAALCTVFLRASEDNSCCQITTYDRIHVSTAWLHFCS